MTASTSPKELLTAYRQSARDLAATNDTPGDRAAFPGLGTKATGMIYLQGGRRLMYRSVETHKAAALVPRELDALLTAEESSTVVADPATHARLMVMADNMPASDYNALGRRLRVSRSLPVSQKLPILTEALSYRYWLQEGLDDTIFEHWCTGFGLDGAAITDQMDSLIELAEDGERSDDLKYPAAVRSMEKTERKIMENCTFSGISTDCHVYAMLDGYGVKANSIRTLDPGLLEMHSIDGQVCRVVPMELRSDSFTASVSTPFKFKEGASCNLTDGRRISAVTMESLRYGGGALHAQFSNPSSRKTNPGEALIARARAGLSRLYAVEIGFESFSRGPEERRWLGEPVARVEGRQVPLDVVLAGASSD